MWGKWFGLVFVIIIIITLFEIWIAYIYEPPTYKAETLLLNESTLIEQQNLSLQKFFSKENVQKVSKIPKIIHQSWKTNELIPFQREFQQSWLRNHPDWKYMFWTDEDNRKLVETRYPQLLQAYDKFPMNIVRADFCRLLYRYSFGGVYVDLDFESLKPLDPILENQTIVLGSMQGNGQTLVEHTIPNAFMASVANHSFWWMAILLSIYSKGNSAEEIAGPVMIYKLIQYYPLVNPVQAKDITILPPKYIYPHSWIIGDHTDVCFKQRSTFNATLCKSFYEGGYAITYWSHTW